MERESKAKQWQLTLPRRNLFEARREGDSAGARRGADDLLGNIPPPLADAGAGDDAPAVGPPLLAGLHSPHDLA